MDQTDAIEIIVSRGAAVAASAGLELALRAWHPAERGGHEQPSDLLLVTAVERGRLAAAGMARILPGRAAVVWLPQFADNRPPSAATAQRIFERLELELKGQGLHIAQALLSGNHHPDEALLKSAGFEHSASLLYLAAPENKFSERKIVLPFEIDAFTVDALPRLARLVERTYIGSQDCPRVDGLRETVDVLMGYQSVGQFRPELWQIAREGSDDVGCLLLNLHPDVRHAEIVYLAVTPEARGRGWGLGLTRHALWLAREANCEHAVLAVDAANEPAIRMYAAAGFSQWDERAVWTKSLR